ncbi:unnamed protein product [Closterium sp. NIES-54]
MAWRAVQRMAWRAVQRMAWRAVQRMACAPHLSRIRAILQGMEGGGGSNGDVALSHDLGPVSEVQQWTAQLQVVSTVASGQHSCKWSAQLQEGRRSQHRWFIQGTAQVVHSRHSRVWGGEGRRSDRQAVARHLKKLEASLGLTAWRSRKALVHGSATTTSYTPPCCTV